MPAWRIMLADMVDPTQSTDPDAPAGEADADAVSPELTARLRAGDPAALGELFAASRERLLRIVQFRLDDRLRARIDAEDVLQEAYLAANSRLEHYAESPYTSPFLWLRAVLTQTLIDLYRRHIGAQMRDPGREVPLDAAASVSPLATSTSLAIQLVGNATSPGEAAARGDMRTTLEAGIAQMDSIDQEVLALRHFEELSNAEAAAVLGIQQKAASIRYVRALRRLRVILAEMTSYFRQRR